MLEITEVLLLKYGEIALKGLNRSDFERRLEKNLRAALQNIGSFLVEREQSTIIVTPRGGSSIDSALKQAEKVFGIVSINRAARTEKSMDSILSMITEYIPPLLSGKKSFKAEARRSDKRFPLKSPEISSTAGALIHDLMPELKVDLYNPDTVVTVEIRSEYAYIHAHKQKGAGGMPAGSNGHGLLLLSGGIDSPVAGYMMAKRGLSLGALHFISEPYTSPRAKEKAVRLSREVEGYAGKIDMYTISLTEIQENIKQYCKEDYFTLILRRFMMNLASLVAFKTGALCLITGESLGQVASQTLPALGVTNDASDIPVFRPCIGLDKSEIIDIARKIGTYDISIEPFDDCCTVFVPKHPVTKPKLDKVLAEEAALDTEGLVSRAFDTLELL